MMDEEKRALFARLIELADRINVGTATTAEIEEYYSDILPRWELEEDES